MINPLLIDREEEESLTWFSTKALFPKYSVISQSKRSDKIVSYGIIHHTVIPYRHNLIQGCGNTAPLILDGYWTCSNTVNIRTVSDTNRRMRNTRQCQLIEAWHESEGFVFFRFSLSCVLVTQLINTFKSFNSAITLTSFVLYLTCPIHSFSWLQP